MPYFAGANSALCAPIPASTTNGNQPLGCSATATVPSAINATSATFVQITSRRLLTRSPSAIAGNDMSAKGSVSATMPNVATRCLPVSSPSASADQASSTTIILNALSLNAPKNCATSRPPMRGVGTGTGVDMRQYRQADRFSCGSSSARVVKLGYMIDLHRLAGFWLVATEGGYSRAARAADYPITQPALHQQVKKLEGEVGLELLERIGKDRMRPTPAGAHLLAFVTPFLRDLPQWSAACAPASSTARCRSTPNRC
jgi:hypothetical protein